MSVAVIGGGPAGIAAAWWLRRGGAEVVLYERRAEIGGALRTDELDGVRVDPAVQQFSSWHRFLFRLLKEAGARDVLVRSPGRDALWRQGRAQSITFGSMASLAGSGALPLGMKLKLAAFYLPYLSRRFPGVNPHLPARSGGDMDDVESVAAWGERQLGRDFVERVAYPILAAYYGAVPERASVGWFHALIREGMDMKLYAVRGGMGALASLLRESLARAGVTVRCGMAIDRVQPEANAVRVFAGESEWTHRAAVIAVPARAVSSLGFASDALVDWLARVEAPPALTLAVVADQPIHRDWFGLVFPRDESPGDRLAAVCVMANKAGGLVPPDRGALLLMPAPSLSAELVANAEASAERLVPALEAAFPGIGRHIVRVKAYRHPQGRTQFHPGYLRHLRGFDERWLPEDVALAGDYLVAPTVEGAVVSGWWAAHRILARLGLQSEAPEE